MTHAGAGSVLLALAAGKRPVVVPRLARLGEAVDDHQLVFARHLAGTGTVTIVEDLAELVPAVGSAGEVAAVRSGPAALTRDLSSYLRQTLRAPV